MVLSASISNKVESYIKTESYTLVPKKVKQDLKDALTDIIACTIAGTKTHVFDVVQKFARKQWGSGDSLIVSTVNKLSASGAAFVNATSANALDIDDGHRLVKGHPGAIVFPAVLAAAEEHHISSEEFMTALLVSYEVGIRAGILAHHLRPEYHCTGSWGAIGAAAGVCRVIDLAGDKVKHALGIAEYQSTYSPMMRCIEHPSMLKDGIGWGSMTGISAAYLAKEGFTGIPSLFENEEADLYIQELGKAYRIENLYYKPYACCRWAQPGIESLKELMQQYGLTKDDVKEINIYTFKESACLSRKYPNNTEEAQYNLAFPIAAYLVTGEVGPNQVLYELENPEILKIMDHIIVHTTDELNKEFPKKALSRMEVEDYTGRLYCSKTHQAKGDIENPLSSNEKRAKFYSLVEPILGSVQCNNLFDCIQNIDDLKTVNDLTKMLERNR